MTPGKPLLIPFISRIGLSCVSDQSASTAQAIYLGGEFFNLVLFDNQRRNNQLLARRNVERSPLKIFAIMCTA